MKRLLILLILIPVWLRGESPAVRKQVFVGREAGIFNVGPVMALNTKTKRTLVVWEKHPGNHPGHSTWGRLIRASGQPAGKPFQIVSGPNTYGPAITYNSNKNEFALIYGNEFAIGFQIFVQRLNRKGRPVGEPVLLTKNSPVGGDGRPRIIYNPDNRTYFVLFNLSSDPSAMDGLYGVVLDENLSFLVNPVLIQAAIPDSSIVRYPLISDLERDPTTGNIVIAYYQYRAGAGTGSVVKADYFLGILDPMLNPNANSFSRVNKKAVKGFGFAMDVAFLEDGTGLLVYANTRNILRRSFDSSGRFLGRPRPAYAPPLKKTKLQYPVLAPFSDSNGSGALVLGVEDFSNANSSGTIWAQQLNEKGQPKNAPIAVEAGFETATQLAVLPLPSGMDKFIAIYVEGIQTVIPPGNQSSGLNLLQLELEDP